MKKGFFIVLSSSLLFLLVMVTGCEDSGRFAASGKIGTLGPGGELTVKLAEDINARAGLNMIDFDLDEEEIDDVKYELGAELFSLSALLDWHIFDGSFHLTGGAISMDNEFTLDGTPTSSVEIGDTTYSAAQIGSLSGKAEIDGLAPYAGIGWGNPFKSKRRWGFTMDLGVAFTNSPEVDICSTGGLLSSDPTFLAELEKERKKIEDDLDSIKFYPVISLGLFYRF
jgi:hypothetical protein